MSEMVRPHRSRRQHQQALAKAHRRRQRRRLARMRRVRMWKTLRSLRLWTRVGLSLVALLCGTFWAKFAYVYDIPDYAHRGSLASTGAYVAVKPWWFGPPVFDLASYAPQGLAANQTDAYLLMLDGLGKYAEIVESPDFVWTSRP